MRSHRQRPGPPRWLRLPRRTARLRLTVLYSGAVFLACGATVLAFTYLLYGLLGHAPHPVLRLHKQGKVVPIAAQPSQATIRVAGLGQIAMNRQQSPSQLWCWRRNASKGARKCPAPPFWKFCQARSSTRFLKSITEPKSTRSAGKLGADKSLSAMRPLSRRSWGLTSNGFPAKAEKL